MANAAALAASCLAAVLVLAAPARAAVSYPGYIANYGGASLTPFDTATNGLGKKIAVSDPAAVAITPDGSTAWIANYSENTVTPVVLATGAVGKAITVENNPDDIAITPDGAKAYVTNFGSDTVSVIDLSTNTAIASIPVGTLPDAIVITPDGTKAYASNSADGTVTPIATSSNTAGPVITVGSGPDTLAVTPDGSTVWVGNLSSGSITPINTSTDIAGPSVTVNDPSAIAITPDGSKAYVGNWNEGTVTPVTLSTGSVRSPIPAGVGNTGPPVVSGVNPYRLAITPDGATAYFGDDNGHTVTPITVATDTAQPNIAMGSGPDEIAITPDQAPVASFTVTPAPAGSPTAFDASASTVKYGAIVSYSWDFGDGNTATTSTPSATHIYSNPGQYTATVTETDTAGTSTAQVFTGSTMSRNGGPTARTSRTVSVTSSRPTSHPARVLISTKSVTITRRGDVLIRLKCPISAPEGCSGTLTLRLARGRPRRAHALIAHCARGCRPLGRRRFHIQVGHSVLVRVHISAYGRRLLAQHHSLHATATAITSSEGRSLTTVRTITIRARAGFSTVHAARERSSPWFAHALRGTLTTRMRLAGRL
ncbi:MAG: PKD domain-containing protein [Solirubrobacteraceae bacterium]